VSIERQNGRTEYYHKDLHKASVNDAHKSVATESKQHGRSMLHRTGTSTPNGRYCAQRLHPVMTAVWLENNQREAGVQRYRTAPTRPISPQRSSLAHYRSSQAESCAPTANGRFHSGMRVMAQISISRADVSINYLWSVAVPLIL
jgi:hypothetical protein